MVLAPVVKVLFHAVLFTAAKAEQTCDSERSGDYVSMLQASSAPTAPAGFVSQHDAFADAQATLHKIIERKMEAQRQEEQHKLVRQPVQEESQQMESAEVAPAQVQEQQQQQQPEVQPEVEVASESAARAEAQRPAA